MTSNTLRRGVLIQSFDKLSSFVLLLVLQSVISVLQRSAQMGLWDVDKIEYVGRAKGPKEDFAFHYYDADKVVAGKKMKD